MTAPAKGHMERIWAEEQKAIFAWFAKDQLYFENNRIDVEKDLIARARAGTGKTTTIIEGVKHAPEKSILICAFSKIIQQELELRIGRNYPNIKTKTLHSVGLSCIHKFREDIKVEFNSSRADSLTESVCGTGAPDAIKRLVTKLHTKGREIAPHARATGSLIDIAITFDCEPDEQWAKSGFPVEYVEARALDAMELAAGIQSGGTIDGSDMIFLPVRNHWLLPQYDLVVVDEAQDMTTAQLEIAKGVLKRDGRICVVGDDRQAIFGFRGANSDSLDQLKSELGAGELRLSTTYRCGKAIVGLAQDIVPDFEADDNNPEGEVIYSRTKDVVGEAGPGDFILSRTNAELVSVAMKLLRAGKRTRIAGRDIGKGLISLVRKFRAVSVPDFLRRVETWNTKEISRLKEQLEKAVGGRKFTIQTKMEGVNDQSDMLISLAEGAKNINEITERIESLFSDDGLGVAGTITCSSVHRSKGLEANRVFVFQDTLRNYNIEEMNIQYVAITRAKQTLVMLSNKVEE